MIAQKKYRRLRGAMVAAGLSQDDLADVLHISPASISNRLRGCQDWRLGEMYTVLDCLGVGKPETVLGYYFPLNGLDSENGAVC